MAGETTRAAIIAGVNTFYDKKFLRQMLRQLRLAPLGQKRPLPENTGDSVEFFRYNAIAVTLTSGVVDSLLAEGTDETATVVTGQALNAAIDEYGDFSKHTKMVKRTHIDRNLEGVSELWGDHSARVIDLLCQQEVCSNGSYPIRADMDADKQIFTSIASATGLTSTTARIQNIASGMGAADDDLNQAVVVFTSGTAAGQARACTDYETTNNLVTWAPALDVTPANGDTVWIASAHELIHTTASDADNMNTLAINRAVRILRQNGTRTFNGYFVGLMNPESEEALKNSSAWANLHTYKDSLGADGMFTGEVGKYGGVRWVSATHPFRFPVIAEGTDSAAYGPGSNGTNYQDDFTLGSATAIISSTLVLGKESFGVTQFQNESGGLKPRIIVKTPGEQTVSQPLNRNSTVGWWAAFVCKALQPMWCVQIWTAEAPMGISGQS